MVIMVDHTLKSNFTVKFLCSYGGKILPRYPDGKLRYVGGDTRVLSVDRCITFRELMLKVRELCGSSAVSLRCQLPTEDLDDALVSVTSDEDLTNLIEEYDRAAPSLKIRAFLFSPKPKITPPSTAKGKSSDRLPSSRSIPAVAAAPTCMMPMGFPVCREKFKLNHCYVCVTRQGNAANNMFLVHNGNHWQ